MNLREKLYWISIYLRTPKGRWDIKHNLAALFLFLISILFCETGILLWENG